ncbi:jg21650 [Pararge aegeria aegeria]|uniref:Jg21650 protein n=1 Tax=Pararge aegeria aegeria TaxID=348720 RepID=A0A8S4RN51_9NEOP|nr:jg21650 [Pararge aegeria aegeria]
MSSGTSRLNTLYQAQVLSCVEYCSHLWDGSAKYQLDALDSVDHRARRLISDLANKKLQSFEHFEECAQDVFDLVSPSSF